MTSLFVGVGPFFSTFIPSIIILQVFVLGALVTSYLVLHRKVKHP